MVLLECSATTARELLMKMVKLGVLRKANNLGKGRYRFVNEDEIE